MSDVSALMAYVSEHDGQGLNAMAFGRLIEIAGMGLAEMEKAAEKRLTDAVKPGLLPKPSKLGEMGAAARQHIDNAKCDLADLDRAIERMSESAARKKADSPYAEALGGLKLLRDELSQKISSYAKSSELELAIVDERQKRVRSAPRESAFATFFNSLFNRAKPEPEGIIVKVENERMYLEFVRSNPQFPKEGEQVELAGRRYIYDAQTDAYYGRSGWGVEVITLQGAYEIRKGRMHGLRKAENFNELDAQRISGKKETYRGGELFTLKPAPARFLLPRQPRPALQTVRA